MLCRHIIKLPHSLPKWHQNGFWSCGTSILYSRNPIKLISRFQHTNSDENLKKKKDEKQIQKLFKPPKGSTDHNPQQMILRKNVVNKIVSVFEKHGAEAIDTPVFERKELLTGQYGEESKLVYDLNDQGGEILSLRYDLTVPFVRYLAMHRIETFKRYQVGKVYRRDEPSVARGRLREFMQCDFDIVGHHDVMLPDSECLKVVSESLNQLLDANSYVIRVNHRLVLDGILKVCGIPPEMLRTICSSIDKYDGNNWSKVHEEMTVEKGLQKEIADKIQSFISIKGNIDDLEQHLSNANLFDTPTSAVEGMEELKILAKYCKILGIEDRIVFDMKLARGLDYYTGMIFEAGLKDDKNKIGSVAGGGRYDNLIGVLNGKNKSIPCVGASIGVERICSLLEAKMGKSGEQMRTNLCDVFVISAHKGVSDDRLKIINMLWDAGIRAEHSPKKNPKILLQIQRCEKYNIPFGIIIGDSEMQQNIVKLRIISTREEIDVSINDLVNEIKRRLSAN